MNDYLPYDPGVLPSSAAPLTGERFVLRIDGLPPYKDELFSIRNPRHKIYPRFALLRQKAIAKMSGRAPFRGAVSLDLSMHAPDFEKSKTLVDFVGGVMDSLDGSHGVKFTYLPIVYEDDCQVAAGQSRFTKDESEWYEVTITFLEEKFETSEQLDAPDAEEYRS
jgi:hypothetical protein